MFNKDVPESLKRKTHLIFNNVIDTRFEHSVAQVRPFRSNSILRFASFCAKGNGYPEPSPHQPMYISLAVNQDVTARQQIAYPARRTRFFPLSYQNYKYVVRQACSKLYILALSRIFSYNQTPGESWTLQKKHLGYEAFWYIKFLYLSAYQRGEVAKISESALCASSHS